MIRIVRLAGTAREGSGWERIPEQIWRIERLNALAKVGRGVLTVLRERRWSVAFLAG
jgi:hypothetical protein